MPGSVPLASISRLLLFLPALASTAVAGTIVWDGNGGPYEVSGTFRVGPNDVLRVLPGAEILLDANAHILVDGGELDVRGTPDDSVHFRPLDPDRPWGALRIENRARARISHAHVSGGTQRASGTGAMIELHDDATLVLVHSELSHCREFAFRSVGGSRYLVADCYIHDAGQGGVASSQGSTGSVFRTRVIRVVDDGIDIRGTPDGDFSYIVDNEVHDGGDDGIDTDENFRGLISGNRISGCADKGISLAMRSFPVVVNNVIWDCRIGITSQSGSDVEIANCTVTGCLIGLRVYHTLDGYGPARATVRNLITWGHTEEAIRVENGHSLDITYSNAQSYTARPGNVFDFDDFMAGVGNVSADPRFSDSAGAVFTLESDSPCIDAGSGDWPAPESDADHCRRLDDARSDAGAGSPPWYDMGAFEYLGARSCDPVPLGHTTYRFNCGSDEAVTTHDGFIFEADREWTAENGAGHLGGLLRQARAPVGGTPDPDLHHEARGSWDYRIDDLLPGTYLVELRFGDIRYHGPGQSRFDVRFDGVEVLDQLDVIAEAGLPGYALRYRLPLEEFDGALLVESRNVLRASHLSSFAVYPHAPDAVPPAAPAEVVAVGGFEQNQLWWADVPDPDVAHFRIHRASAPGGPYDPVGGKLHATRYIDRDVTPGQEHHYRVTAVDAYGNAGEMSEAVSASPRARTESALPVWEIRLSPADWDLLNANPQLAPHVPATFVAAGVEHVARVKYRGSSTRKYPKKSWKVDFDGFLFEGREELNLNAEMPDKSLIREDVAYRFLQDAGVGAARARHVQLFVNGMDHGVYTEVENVDRWLVERLGLPRGGNLYRAFDRMVPLDHDSLYAEEYEKKTNRDEGMEDLVELIELIDGTTPADFFLTVMPVFDLEGFYRAWAANSVLQNDDFGRDDYFLYHDLEADYWHWIPWDYNETFGNTINFVEGVFFTRNIFPGDHGNALMGRLLQHPYFKRRHLDRVRELMDTGFSEARMSERFAEAHARIRDSALADWSKWGWEDNTYFEESVADLEYFVTQRQGYIQSRLPAELPPPFLTITEVMADNRSTHYDESSDFDDWVEIHNPTDSTVVLTGFYLSDDPRNPLKWSFPGVSIGPGAYMVVWCDGEENEGPLHTNFALQDGGEWIGLFGRWPGTDGLGPIDARPFGEQFPDVAWGRDPAAGYRWTFLPAATPGAVNDTGGNVPPQITGHGFDPRYPRESDPVWISSTGWDDDTIRSMELVYRTDGGWTDVTMSDDGAHHDGSAGDGRYGISVGPWPAGTEVRYYFKITDDLGSVTRRPFDAPDDAYALTIHGPPSPVLINEFVAANIAGGVDEVGDHDDWVELYNAGSSAVSLAGMYLTDDLSRPERYPLPDVSLDPGDFLVVWCDGEPEEGSLHAPFGLSQEGESLGLFEDSFGAVAPVDTLHFGRQTADISLARASDGGESWEFRDRPSPGTSNDPGSVPPPPLYLGPAWPNPARGVVTVRFGLPSAAPVRLEVFDLGGRRVRVLLEQTLPAGDHQVSWDGASDRGVRLASGLYFLRLEGAASPRTLKLVLLR